MMKHWQQLVHLKETQPNNEKQMKKCEQLMKLGKAQGSPAFRSSTDTGSSWIIIDFVSVVVHLFEPNQRAYYDLEGLWGDAERVTWRKSGGAGEAA